MSLSGNDNIAPVTFDEFRAIVDKNAKRYISTIPEVVSDIAAELGVPADSPAMNILRKKLNVMRSLDTSELMRSYDALPSDRKSRGKRRSVTASPRPYGSGRYTPVPHSFDEFRAIVDKNAKRYSSTIPEVVSDIAAELGVPADSPAIARLRKKLNVMRSLDADELIPIYDALPSGCKTVDLPSPTNTYSSAARLDTASSSCTERVGSFDWFRAIVDKNAKSYFSPIPEVVRAIAAELGLPTDSPAMNKLAKKLKGNRNLDADVLMPIYEVCLEDFLSDYKSTIYSPTGGDYSANSSASWQNATSSSHSGGAGRNASVSRSDAEAFRLLGWVEVKL